MEISPIAFFSSPFKTKFGIPRQSGIVEDVVGEVVFEKQYQSPEAVRGLQGFDYIWLIWGFTNPAQNPVEADAGQRGYTDAPRHKHTLPLTVRPPRLGGNERVGVFASRSPFRPNSLALSSVRLLAVETGKLIVAGADLMDGTPIYDIKPYVPFTDCHVGAAAGFVDQNTWKTLDVIFPEPLRTLFSHDEQNAIIAALSQDPRPQYHASSKRVYGMPFASYDIRFTVTDDVVTITEVKPLTPAD